MKYFVLCALSFFLGSVVGGVSPKRELQKIKQQQNEITIQKDCTQSTIGSDLAHLMTPKSSAKPTPKKNPFGDRSPEEITIDNPEAVEIAERIDENEERFQEKFQENMDRSEEEPQCSVLGMGSGLVPTRRFKWLVIIVRLLQPTTLSIFSIISLACS